MTDIETRTIQAPGVVLTYDVRKNDETTEPPLFLIGSPMGAAGYGSLVKYFGDRTLITYDPRGSERSERTPDAPPSSPEIHAEDVHLVIQEVGGPVDLFASSGGAVNAFALLAKHPEAVRILIAHEPPDFAVLPDRAEVFAAVDDMSRTYQERGFGPALAKFILLTSHQGPVPANWTDQPDPDPQMFGLPTEDDGSRDDPLLAQNMTATARYEPDFEALRTCGVPIVLAAGEESAGQLTWRATHEVAKRLGTDVVVFPGGHGGFMGGEYGQPPGKPEEFAAKLREVLASQTALADQTVPTPA